MRSSRLLAMVFLFASSAFAQSGVKVEVDDVTDNRISEGMMTGSLELRVKLTGTGLDKATGARVLIKEARDDRGTSLADTSRKPDFTPRDYNSGTLQVSMHNPARAASTVKIKGTVELYVPGRDPNAMVKIDKALSKLDTPIASSKLKAAKIEITPLSPAGYAALMKTRKLDDKKIAEIRAEGKKQGVPEKEIEMAIELAKAMEGLDTPPSPNSIVLAGESSDFERIFRVEILGADGQPLSTPSRGTSTRGDSSMMNLDLAEPPPANAALQFFVLTDKAKMSFPFELNVTLP